MPTVIDSLIVEIGLDPSKFTEGEKATLATLGKTQRALRQMADDAEEQARRTRSSSSATSHKASADKKASISDSKADAKQAASDAKTKETAEKKRLAEERKAKSDADKADRDARRKKQEELRKAQKEREDGVKKTGELFKSAKNEALAFLAVAVGAKGIEAFTRDSVLRNADLGRSASNIGVNVPELSAYQNMVQRNGGSPEAVTASLQGLTDQMEQLKVTGNNAILPFLQMIPGVSSMSKATDIVKAFVGWADQHRNDRPLVNLVGKGLGLDQGLINEALKGSTQFMKDFADAQKAAANPEQTRRAAELQSSWEKLGQSFGKVGDKVLYDFEPPIKGAMDTISDFADKSPGWAAAILGALGALSGAALIGKLTGLLRLLGIIKGVATETGAAAEAAEAVAVAGGGGAAATTGTVAAGGAEISAGAIGAGAAVIGGAGAYLSTAGLREQTQGAQRDARDAAARGDGAAAGAVAAGIAAARDGAPQGPVETHPASDPRGIRNNDPGNLQYVGQEGAVKESGTGGRFAVFRSMPEGIAALVQQVRRYASRGIDTVRKIISKWAPPNENNTEAYIQSVAKDLGVNPDQKIDANNASVDRTLVKAISSVENGRGRLKEADIDAGLARLDPVPSAQALARLGPGPAPDPALNVGASTAAGSIANDNRSTSTSTSDTKIGSIVIQTQATDAQGIMRDAAGAARSSFASQANSGMS